jgi:aspartyl-tRNA(Asn)/glutamyl-tRNA(Gln) amidotransferase subunit A
MAFRNLSLGQYIRLSGHEMARGVADGILSPVQLAECALYLAKATEPKINAYVTFLDDYANTIASEREVEARQQRIRGALHGVPIAIKDNFYLAGFAVKKGSRTSSDQPATYNSPMVERLLAAGVVAIGKTTTPEFGWKGTGNSPLTGITRNPYDPSKNPGGSSAGSAATVAARAVPIAIGSDAGGSIRIPASFCGLVGLKPTLSKIPVYPGTVTETLSHAGILCREVEDVSLTLAATAGPDVRDPLSFAANGNGEANRLARMRAGKIRVGILEQPFGIAPGPEVASVFTDALRVLRDGLPVEFCDTIFKSPLPRDIFETFWVTGRGYGFVEIVKRSRELMDPGLARCYDLAQNYTLPQFFKAIEARRKFVAEAFALCEAFDLLVMPTMPLTAFAAEAEVPECGEADAPLPWVTWTPYTYPFNLSGQPAISIPAGMSSGLPVGLQIVGAWGCDELVLGFAKLCELALARVRIIMPLPAVVSDAITAG